MNDDTSGGAPSIRFRFEGDPRPTREYCDRCSEAYLPENLDECISCHDSICYQCTTLTVKPGTKDELACICRMCKKYKAGWWNDNKPETLDRTWSY